MSEGSTMMGARMGRASQTPCTFGTNSELKVKSKYAEYSYPKQNLFFKPEYSRAVVFNLGYKKTSYGVRKIGGGGNNHGEI
jgi:hypothetical protein